MYLILCQTCHRSTSSERHLTLSLRRFQSGRGGSILVRQIDRRVRRVTCRRGSVSRGEERRTITRARGTGQVRRRTRLTQRETLTTRLRTRGTCQVTSRRGGLTVRQRLRTRRSGEITSALTFLTLKHSLKALSIARCQSNGVRLTSLLTCAT